MTSSPHGLYVQGYTRATMASTKRCKLARGSQSSKACLSSDWSLQLDSMKLESLVIADQHAAVNTFPGLVHTARHITKVGCTRSRQANRKEADAYGMIHDWGEVVTR
jgi:Tfp pilus assembly major pilin PilA